MRKPLDVDVRRRYTSHIDPGDLGRILRLGGQILAEVTAPDALDLQAIAAPVTLVWGRHDALCPCAGSEVVVAALPATRVVLLEDAGHCAHLDEPAEVARILDAA